VSAGIDLTALRRFLKFVELCPLNGCWLWKGGIDRYGYGKFSFEGRTVKAHRWSWEMLRGGIPEGMKVDHTCRVRHCVNPYHGDPITNRQNTVRGIESRKHRGSLPLFEDALVRRKAG
jgi:hypothetical protein